jgi:hypothetical protein
MKIVSIAHRFLSILLTEKQKHFLRNNLHLRIFRNSIALWRFNESYGNLSEKDKIRTQQIFSRVRLRSGNSDIAELPFEININSDLCELYGLLTGDGSVLRVCRFYNTNETLVKKFDELLYKNFKVTTRQEETRNHHYVPKVIQVVLENLFGKKGYSRTAKVPPIMFNLEKEFVKAYIRGLFDTDGCSSHEPPKLTSSSIELLKGVKMLLSNKVSIESRIRCNRKNDYDLIIGNSDKYNVFFNTLKFYENINFNHSKKKKLLEKKIVDRTLYKTLCLVRNGCNSSSEVRDKLGISWTIAIDHLNKLEEFGLLDKIKTNDGNKHLWFINESGRRL